MKQILNKQITIITILIVIMVSLSSVSARVRNTAYIGKINLQAVILFHPAMSGYDPYVGAFKADPRQVSPQQMQQKAQQNSAMIKKLQDHLRLLNGRLEEAHRNYDRKLQTTADKYLKNIEKLATGAAYINRSSYKKAMNQIKVSYDSKIKALGIQSIQTQEKLEQYTKLNYRPGYTDPVTTQKKFAAILSEIKKYTQQIASQKGIQIVLNSSNNDIKLKNQQADILPSNLDFSKAFNMPFPNEIRNDASAVSGYYSVITSISYNWLNHGQKILEPFRGYLKNTDVFIGGYDLTNEVISAIYRAYKIDQHIGNAIMQSIQQF